MTFTFEEKTNLGIDITDKYEILRHAILNSDHKKVKELLDQGLDAKHLYEDGKTALHFARNIPTANLLLTHNADINAKDDYGNTPLHTSIDNSRDDVDNKLPRYSEPTKSLLLIKKADSTRDNDNEVDAIYIVKNDLLYTREQDLYGSELGGIPIDQLSLDENDKTFKLNYTPLDELPHLMEFTNFLYDEKKDLSAFLVKNGADVTAADVCGYTPLHHADSEGLAELLLSKGADIHTTTSVLYQPLHIYAIRCNIKLINLALNKGANIDAMMANGATPLMCAHHPEVVKLLLARGANPTIICDDAVERPEVDSLILEGKKQWISKYPQDNDDYFINNTNEDEYTNTAMISDAMKALRLNNRAVLQKLQDAGFNLEEKYDGKTIQELSAELAKEIYSHPIDSNAAPQTNTQGGEDNTDALVSESCHE